MKRFALIAMTAATLLAADARVFVTEHGKIYHQNLTCMSLSRATPEHVHEVGEAAATEHGLRRCGMCWRAAAKKKAPDAGWMKGGAK